MTYFYDMDQNKKLNSSKVRKVLQRLGDIYSKFCVFCLIVSNETANTHFTFSETRAFYIIKSKTP